MEKIKVAHFGYFCPHSNGMFFTTKDLILGEREAGIDAQFIDWGNGREYGQQISRVGLEYEGIKTVAPAWAIKEADILVLHSAIPKDVKATGKPIITTMHGRPEYSFELERLGKGGANALYLNQVKDKQVKAFITFWQEHVAQWELLFNTKIDFVPATVDLHKYNPNGKKYDFSKHGPGPHIILADVWREDQTPFNVLLAAANFIKKLGHGKVHLFGLSEANKNKAYANIFNELKKQKIVGEVHGLIKYMDDVYRGADLFVTPHVIATRTVREACACGCPMVAGSGNRYTGFRANQMDINAFSTEIEHAWNTIQGVPKKSRELPREIAEKNFAPRLAGEAMKPIFERIVKEEKNKPVVEIKPVKPKNFKIHNFIAYAPKWDDKNIGKQYNEYMDLIGENDWACFIDHDAMFTTSDWYHQLYEIIDNGNNNLDYGLLTAVTNRIGNKDQMFVQIDKKNHDMLYHRKFGRTAQEQFYTEVKDVTNGHQAISGVVMLINKQAWKEAGKFKENEFLGIDNDIHLRMRKTGYKVGVMKGVYVYHVYRADESAELQPVGGI